MNLLSRLFSLLLLASMSLLVAGLLLQAPKICAVGLAILLTIPIFRAIYATVWFYLRKNRRAMWFSVIALVALAISITLGV